MLGESCNCTDVISSVNYSCIELFMNKSYYDDYEIYGNMNGTTQISFSTFWVSNFILLMSIFIGLPANIVVISTILQCPSLKSRLTNMLIVNLCLTDLLTVTFDVPLIWMITYTSYHMNDMESVACDIQVSRK